MTTTKISEVFDKMKGGKSMNKEIEAGLLKMVNLKEKWPKDEKDQPVPILALFSYSSTLDRILILVGISVAFIMGMIYPMSKILYGEVTGAFVKNAATNEAIVTNSSIHEEHQLQGVFHCSMYLFILGFAIIILCYLSAITLNTAAKRQTQRIRLKFFESVLHQDMSYFDMKPSKDFATKLASDLQAIEVGIGEKIGLVVYFSSTSIFSAGLAIYFGWKLAFSLIIFIPLITISKGFVTSIQARMSLKEMETYAITGAIAEEVLGAVRTVLAFGGENKEVGSFAESLQSVKLSGIRRACFTSATNGVLWFSLFITFGFGYWCSSKLMVSGEYTASQSMSVVSLMVCSSYFFGLASPHLEALSMARAAATAIFKTIQRKPKIMNCASVGKRPQKVSGKIKFENVFFSYPARPEISILQGLNLSIDAGQTIALVGSSGCGKSTVLKLVQRLYDPLYGNIFFDDNNIKDLNLGWLRDQVGTVGQDPVLFAMSIKENIRLGHLSATDEDIVLAAKVANAHDFITKLPFGYDTVLGEKGAQISGGQKQRLAIARAFVKDPKILLLDEATSALDFESEALVQAALEKASVDRTTLIVAHRLSTIRNADKIIVMDKGVVKETGTHEELLEKKGFYYKLISAHHSTSEPESTKIVEPSGDEQEDTENTMLLTPQRNEFLENRMASEIKTRTELKYRESLCKMVLDYKLYLSLGVLAAVLNGLTIPTYAIIYGKMIGLWKSNYLMEQKSDFYGFMFLIVGIVALIVNIFQNITLELRTGLFQAYLRQEPAWFDDHRNGVASLCARLSTETAAVQNASGTPISMAMQGLTMMTAIIALSFFFHWKLAVAACIMLPIALAMGVADVMIAGESLKGNTKSNETSTRVAVEAISNISTVISLRLENHFYNLFKAEIFCKTTLTDHFRGVLLGFSQSFMMLTYGPMLYYGGHLVLNNEIDYSVVLTVTDATLIGASQFGLALGFLSVFRKGKAAANEIFKIINRRPTIDKMAGKEMTNMQGEIKFDSVSFSYPRRPDALVLNDLKLILEPGKTTAIVGTSGCGKSTCIQLLLRFYDVDRGQVLINDCCIKDLRVDWLRSRIGLVQQEPTLFNRSIHDNIAYGDNSRNVETAEIVEAAEKANIHSFIQSLPAGYSTKVGDCGSLLSGGQKQRISIARALVRNPEILLLDEATSALDSESEKIVQETLTEAMKGRTCVVIAHRLSTIQNVDKIVVLKDGQVVEEGTHDDLIRLKGAYFKLWNK